jgi:hypothetical protein
MIGTKEKKKRICISFVTCKVQEEESDSKFYQNEVVTLASVLPKASITQEFLSIMFQAAEITDSCGNKILT